MPYLSTADYPKYPWDLILVALTAVMFLLLSGCAPAPSKVPPPPTVVEVKVPVPVPCEIASVDQPDYPSNTARPTDDIFTLIKIALAERQVLKGEVKELRGANEGACK
jgi:hypothetical protein